MDFNAIITNVRQLPGQAYDWVVVQGPQLWHQSVEIWRSGGWAMIAIAAVGLLMFGMGTNIYLRLWRKARVPEKTWRRWLEHPHERTGPIGDLLNAVTVSSTLDEAAIVFEETRASDVAPFRRDLLVMKICVNAAPLLGLLGTVMGMLATFDALASGSGGDKAMGQIAEGISEALITTETGLIIALPGLFFHYQLTRKYERYKAFLAQLETVSAQHLYRRLQASRRTAA